jgi:hypothetical protein
LYVQHKLYPIDKVVPELDKALGLTRKRIDCIQISQTNVKNFITVLEMMHSENGVFKQLKTHVNTFCDDGGYISDLMNKVFECFDDHFFSVSDFLNWLSLIK